MSLDNVSFEVYVTVFQDITLQHIYFEMTIIR